MTRINPRITTTGFSSSTLDNAKTDTSPAPKIGDAQDKSLNTAGIIPKGSPPLALREFVGSAKKMNVEKNGQLPLQKPAADSSHTATGADKKPQSRGMHHPSLKKFFNSIPPGVMENAMLSAGSISLAFGVGAALNNIARTHGNPAIKVTGALFPAAAGMASAYIEKGIRETFDVKSTEFQHPWLSAISPAAFMSTNYAYTLSPLPKFPPNTPAGIVTTVAVSALGAGIGGALAETAAQMSKKNASSPAPAASDPGNKPTTFEHGLGRAFTQIPAVYLNKVIAAKAAGAGGVAPRNLLLAVPATIGIPFIFRNEMASMIADSRKHQSSGQTSSEGQARRNEPNKPQ